MQALVQAAWWASALVGCVLVTSCEAQKGQAPPGARTTVAAAQLAPRPAPACVPPAAGTPRPGLDQVVTVFAFCGSSIEAPPALHPLARVIPDDQAPLRGALTQLLLGVTPREAEAGFTSSFSSFTAGLLRDVSIQGGVATLDLARGFEMTNNFSTATASVGVMALIDATVFRFPEVTGLEIRIEGKRWCGFEAGECDGARSRRPRP